MQYVKTGGYDISKYTLGTVQLGMEYGIANKSGKPDMDKSFEILRTALDGGINSIDTALLYGDSELVIGSFFSGSGYDRKQILLTTKFKLSPGEDLSHKDVEKQLRGFVEQSLERLKAKQLPVYMLHNPKDMTHYGKAVPETLLKLQKEGLIGKAGVSVYTPAEVEEMLKNDLYEAVQLPMNIFDTRFVKSGVLKKLHAAGKIVFVRSVFLQGLFFSDPAGLKGVLKEAEAPLRQLASMAEHEGMSIAQLALSYIRDMEEVTSLVIGAETPQQVRDNIQLVEGPGISEKTRSEAYKLFDGMSVRILDPNNWKG